MAAFLATTATSAFVTIGTLSVLAHAVLPQLAPLRALAAALGN